MGWQLDTIEIYGNDVMLWYTANGRRAWHNGDFKPSTNLLVAWQVEEAMLKRGLGDTYAAALLQIVTHDGAQLYGSAIEVDTYTDLQLDSAKVVVLIAHATPVERCCAALRAVGFESTPAKHSSTADDKTA